MVALFFADADAVLPLLLLVVLLLFLHAKDRNDDMMIDSEVGLITDGFATMD